MKALLLVLLLTGSSGTLTDEKIELAIKLCENNGGIGHIYVSSLTYKAYCNNDARFILISE